MPEPARAANYNYSSFSEGFQAERINQTPTAVAGKAWYPWNFMGWQIPANIVRPQADGTALIGQSGSHNAQLASAAIDRRNGHILGVAFGGGGYFEAEIAFDAQAAASSGPADGWPSFFGLAWELLERKGKAQWPGQVQGYERYIEVDIMEYNLSFNSTAKNVYGTDMHDFYGIQFKTCAQWYCDRARHPADLRATVPVGTDFSQFHRYGMLWQKETANSAGTVKYYFDRVQVGKPVEWRKGRLEDEKPPLDKQSYIYSALDRQHLVLVLGSGAKAPIRVRKVEVWQASDTENLR